MRRVLVVKEPVDLKILMERDGDQLLKAKDGRYFVSWPAGDRRLGVWWDRFDEAEEFYCGLPEMEWSKV